MIRNWKYHDGKPIWSPTLNDYIGAPSPPYWHCMIYKRESHANEIERWLESNLDNVLFDANVRFNSGDPALFINIYDTDAAALFYMTWVDIMVDL